MEEAVVTAAAVCCCCCYLCLCHLTSVTCSQPKGLKDCQDADGHAAYFHASCFATIGSCPLCYVGDDPPRKQQQQPIALLCDNAIVRLVAATKRVTKEAEGEDHPARGGLRSFLNEVERLTSLKSRQVLVALYDGRVCEALYGTLACAESEADVCLALHAIRSLAEGPYRDPHHRLGAVQGPYRVCVRMEAAAESEVVAVACIKTLVALIANDRTLQAAFQTARALEIVPECVRLHCKSPRFVAWVPAIQALRAMLRYNMDGEDEHVAEACGSLVSMLKQAGEERVQQVHAGDSEADEQGITARVAVVDAVGDLCTEDSGAGIFHGHGACRLLCLLAVKCRYEEAVQMATFRAVTNLAMHCEPARAYLAEPMSIIFKRFLSCPQHRLPQTGARLVDVKAQVGLLLRTVTALCNNRESTAAAEAMAREGICEAAVQALRDYKEDGSTVVQAAEAIGKMTFMCTSVTERFMALKADEALLACEAVGGREVTLALAALGRLSVPLSARRKAGGGSHEGAVEMRKSLDEEDDVADDDDDDDEDQHGSLPTTSPLPTATATGQGGMGRDTALRLPSVPKLSLRVSQQVSSPTSTSRLAGSSSRRGTLLHAGTTRSPGRSDSSRFLPAPEGHDDDVDDAIVTARMSSRGQAARAAALVLTNRHASSEDGSSSGRQHNTSVAPSSARRQSSFRQQQQGAPAVLLDTNGDSARSRSPSSQLTPRSMGGPDDDEERLLLLPTSPPRGASSPTTTRSPTSGSVSRSSSLAALMPVNESDGYEEGHGLRSARSYEALPSSLSQQQQQDPPSSSRKGSSSQPRSRAASRSSMEAGVSGGEGGTTISTTAPASHRASFTTQPPAAAGGAIVSRQSAPRRSTSSPSRHQQQQEEALIQCTPRHPYASSDRRESSSETAPPYSRGSSRGSLVSSKISGDHCYSPTERTSTSNSLAGNSGQQQRHQPQSEQQLI